MSQPSNDTIRINENRQVNQGCDLSNPVGIAYYPEEQLRKLGKALQDECLAHNTTRLAFNGELHLRLAAECTLWNERGRLSECSKAYQIAREQLHQLQAANTQLSNDLHVLRSKFEALTSRNESLEKQVRTMDHFLEYELSL